MKDPLELKQEEEKRLITSIEEKKLEVQQELKRVALAKEQALVVLDKIRKLVVEAHDQYTQMLRETKKIEKVR